jgi:hypothetical protein
LMLLLAQRREVAYLSVVRVVLDSVAGPVAMTSDPFASVLRAT